MAKKNGTLTNLFVPEEEHPYSIPENWCWVTVGTIASAKGGKRVPKGNQLVEYKTEHPYIRVTDFDNHSIATEQVKYIDEETFKLIHNYTISTNDIYISIAGTIGKVGVIPDDLNGANLTENAAKITSIRGVKKSFLLWLLESEIAQSQMRNSTISTTQPKLALFRIENIKIPLAPLAEQQRIVDRIESLFSKLDEAKEKAQVVVDGFELRKSVILYKAFTGELTERWRKEHGVRLDSWETKRINEITRPRAGYAFDSKKFTKLGYQIIRMGNLHGGELDLSRNPVFISLDDVDETALKRALVNNGDILITLTGTKYKRDYGYAVSIIDPTNLLVNQRILCLTPCQDVERNYILYYLRSNIFRDIFFSNETGGVNQGNVSSKFVENIEIEVPLLAEQHEIVTILDRMMDKEQHSKEAAEAVLEQIDTMKKAILARAFRGELGTNDPAEEWAGKLVKKLQRQN